LQNVTSAVAQNNSSSGSLKFSQPNAKGKRKKPDTKILDHFHDSDYPSTDESEDGRVGGAKKHPLLLKISRPYRITPEEKERGRYGSDVKKRFRCIASKSCGVTWK
jgi:hypothetical protein